MNPTRIDDPVTGPATTTDVLRFALRQGPLRRVMHPPIQIDERIATTATVPPATARGARHRSLPAGTTHLLAQHPIARPDEAPGHVLGHLLVRAFGLQRREPSNPANDHRTVASVRSKFPVHVLVLGPDDPPGYLDLYRHAIVDLAAQPADDPAAHPAQLAALRPEPDSSPWSSPPGTPFPTPYGILRCALADLETGINLRALLVAAQLFGVEAVAHTGGPIVAAAADLVAATGPGSSAAPVVVTLRRTGPLPAYATAGTPTCAIAPDLDLLLRRESQHPTLLETGIVNDIRGTIRCPSPGARPRRASRNYRRRTAELGPGAVAALCRPGTRAAHRLLRPPREPWPGLPRRPAPLGEVAGTDGHAACRRRTGAADRGGAAPRRPAHRAVRRGLRRTALRGHRSAAAAQGGAGLRVPADRAQRLRGTPQHCGLGVLGRPPGARRRAGTGRLGLLQVYCGWVAHGLTMAAAGHGLFARPARSFDEHQLAALLALPDNESPVFITVCGQSRYAEPMLDLRV